MPLVAHNDLPSYRRLRSGGVEIWSLQEAASRPVRELHIGLLNMMPDAALAATEQQFMRLVGACRLDAAFYVYPFSISELNRGQTAEKHVLRYYSDFSVQRERGLDALIITGANVIRPALDKEPLWGPLIEVSEWAHDNVASTLCSCLATHAILKSRHGIDRQRLPQKKWGVFQHEVTRADHALLQGVAHEFDAPHSRFNVVAKSDIEHAELSVLVETVEGDVHMAVSKDQFRTIYFQGHPEYDANSLLKEYKREVLRFLSGEIETAPPYPENYIDGVAIEISDAYLARAVAALSRGAEIPEFPEQEIAPYVSNTWGDTGRLIFDNWLRRVAEITTDDRRLQFAPGVDPNDPLGLNPRSY